jgi:hypothetical protein
VNNQIASTTKLELFSYILWKGKKRDGKSQQWKSKTWGTCNKT